MTETVKVFKNTGGTAVVPGDMDAAIDYTLHTTAANESVVIKDVEIILSGFGAKRVKPIIDLDGYAAATGTGGTLSVDGSLIMGPSSTLKFKATPSPGAVIDDNSFYGMVWFEGGSSGRQFLSGNGVTTTMSPVKQSSSNHACDDGTGAVVKGTMHGGSASGTRFYYQLYNNQIRKWNEAGTQVHSWTHGSTGYGMCNDGTYIYRSAGTNGQQIYRTKMSDQTESTLTCAQNYGGPQANQGGIFVYHQGKIYSRTEGGNSWLDIIDLSPTNPTVTRKNDGNFVVGGYSDGGFTTTTTAGKNYVVECGTSYSYYYDIDLDSVTRVNIGTQSSTEYAQGGAEVAVGIGIIFGEHNDRATTVDMNTKTFTTSSNSTHGYTTDYSYGNRFGFAGILKSNDPDLLNFEYEAFVSGVEIT